MRNIVWWQCLAVVVVFLTGQGEAFAMTARCAPCSPSAMQHVSHLGRQGSSCRGGTSSCAKHRAHHSSRRGNRSRDSLSPLFAVEERTRVEDEVLDVAIVGAGPAGLALAIGLRSKGLHVKVFEAAPEMSNKGAAVFLQSIGVAKLNEIQPGLADEAVAAGCVVECIHLTRPSGETIARVDMTALERVVGYPFLGITRYKLQRVLLNHLPEGTVQVGSRLEGLETHEVEGVTELTFEGRTNVVRARAVVGADGRKSVVRKKVLASEEIKRDWALTWWALADMPDPVTPKGEFRMSYSSKRAIYYGEVEEGVTMWSFTSWREGEIERDPDLRAGRALKELEGWPEEVLSMVRCTSPTKLIEVFVGDSPLQWKTWSQQPGVSLIGDAAHAMLPSLAMGVTTALQDATALTKCIDGVETPLADALRQYERERRVPTALLQLASRMAMVFIENVLCR